MLHWGKLCLLCCLLLLTACSSTTFVYNRLDFILPWYVDDYAELNGEQKDYLDELLSPFLAWHRARELPRYIKILDSIEVSLDKPMTPENVAAVSLEFELAWFRLEGETLDWLLDLGSQLSDEQVAGFLDALWEKQREYEEEYLQRSDTEFFEESYDNMRDSARDYLGRISKEQRAFLQGASGRLLRSDKTWLLERAAWLQRMAVLLERKPGWQQRVRDSVAARDENVSVEYQRIYGHNLEVINASVAELLNGRTDKQDQHLRNKLSKLRNDLQILVAQR